MTYLRMALLVMISIHAPSRERRYVMPLIVMLN